MLYYFFFIIRRQIMVFTLVFMPKFGNLQLSLHILCSFTSLVYTALVKPYINESQNSQEICNEVFILLGGYHMIVFTDFVPDEFVTELGKNFKTQIGWSLIAVLAANVAFNISLISREVILNVINSCKNRRAKAARLKEIEL